MRGGAGREASKPMTLTSRRDCWDAGAFRTMIGAICAGLALSSVAAIGLAIFGGTPSWALIGFEVIILFSAGIGALEAIRHSRHGPAMTLLCVAGAVGVGSLLGFIGANKTLAGFDLHVVLGARLLTAAIVAAAAGCIVISRDPSNSLPSLVKGLIAGAVFVGLCVGAWVMRGAILGAGGAARVGFVVVTGIAVIALVSASIHYLVRAFAVGVGPRFDEPGAPGA